MDAEARTAGEDLAGANAELRRLAISVKEAEDLGEEALREFDALTARVEELRNQGLSSAELVERLTASLAELDAEMQKAAENQGKITEKVNGFTEDISQKQIALATMEKDQQAMELALQNLLESQEGSRAQLEEHRAEIARLQAANTALAAQVPAEASMSTSVETTLANGKAVTEENVLELLRQIEQDWPTGTVWGTRKTPGTHKNEVPCTQARQVMDAYRVSETYGCSGYASMVSSLIFGDEANPARRLEDLSQIRPGDIIFMVRNETGKVWHVTVALESPNEKNAFHITDGNAGETVQWPDRENPYGRDNLDCYCGEGKSYHLEVWTRYPESVPYTGDSVMGWPTGTNK